MFPKKVHKSTFILVALILASLTFVLAGGGKVQAALARTASLIPAHQEVTLGDEYRSEEGGFSFLTIPGYTVEESFGFITMSAPGADPDIGPAIMFMSSEGEEGVTSEEILAEMGQDMDEGFEMTGKRAVTVDGLTGLTADISGTDETGQAAAGRHRRVDAFSP